MDISLMSLFSSIGLVHGLWLPIIAIAAFALLALPGISRSAARPEMQLRAIYCYVAQVLGILLMTAGALPAVYAVFAVEPLNPLTYLGLLLVFATGGGIFLFHDAQLNMIDTQSKAVPEAVFIHAWKMAGLLITVCAVLSLVLTLLVVESNDENWWVIHMIMILYGLLISWFTMFRPESSAPFTSTSTSATPTATKTKPSMRKKSSRKPKKKS